MKVNDIYQPVLEWCLIVYGGWIASGMMMEDCGHTRSSSRDINTTFNTLFRTAGSIGAAISISVPCAPKLAQSEPWWDGYPKSTPIPQCNPIQPCQCPGQFFPPRVAIVVNEYTLLESNPQSKRDVVTVNKASVFLSCSIARKVVNNHSTSIRAKPGPVKSDAKRLGVAK